jgi:cytochrome c-type biogenesis protein CcmH
MEVWPYVTVLCSAAAVAVSYPLIRRYESSVQRAQRASEIYGDQLKEVSSDVEAGTISATDAAQAKLEIERRAATVAKAVDEYRPLSPTWRKLALASTAGFVILGSINLYGYLGRPDLVAMPVTQAQAPQAAAVNEQGNLAEAVPAQAAAGTGQVDDMIKGLAAKLAANPQDADGWRMLGWSYFNLQKYAESVEAYRKALALDSANIDYKSSLAEALVQSSEGMVTPEAKGLIADVLAKDAKDLRARFYDALAHEQAGDQNGSLDRWLALLSDAPPDAGWREDVKSHIAELGKATGRDVAAVLALPSLAPVASNQPLAANEQNAMVDGMIAKLTQKLQANPKDRDGWAMMIRSLTVRGDKAGAEKALADALAIFKDDPATVEGLKSIATSAQFGKAASGTPPVAAGAAAPDLNSVDQTTRAAVENAAPADQQAMIKGMVAKLAARLDASPNDSEGWIRLMRAYTVLQDQAAASAALAKAMQVFAGDPTKHDAIMAAAKDMGVN